MKRLISLTLVAVFTFLFFNIPAYALETQEDKKTVSIEYLDDGSYYVIEVVNETNPYARSSKSGTKTATYYNSAGKAIWQVTVRGSFTYTSGVSSKATSATATVLLIDNSAVFSSKNAYVSGSSAYGYGQVTYNGVSTSKTVVLTCDSRGNLS